MPINVSEAIDSDTGEKILVERETAGQYVDGLYVPGAVTTFKNFASVQPASDEEIQQLPEGERNKLIFKFIAKRPIRTTEDRKGQIADVILYDNTRWRVIGRANWLPYGHNIIFAAAE